jgi:histidyl-tRNA synthetase
MQGKAALPGFRDFYPDDLALRSHIFATWRAVAARYGFVEYDGPPLEPLELYTRKSGEEIVRQLYAFRDKGDREVALRPEMTPTLARMVAARAQALKKPIRWFSIPQLFRYERQQRGRLREHFQLNMDLIGEAGPLADAELIAAAVDVMRAFGLGSDDVKVRVSDRRVLRALLLQAGLTDDQLSPAYAAIDKVERVEPSRLEQAMAQALAPEAFSKALDIAAIRGEDALRERAHAAGCSADAEPLFECLAALRAMQLSEFVTVDLSIVRGLAYYTGIVFELFDAQGSLRAICGGGRYDGLLGALGGVDLPALGFGMGDVVLGELLRARGTVPQASGRLDAFFVAVGTDDLPRVLELVHALRDRGVAVEYALRPGSVRKQLELAAARQASRAVIVGPDERAAQAAVVRDLGTGSEAHVPFDTLLNGHFG